MGGACRGLAVLTDRDAQWGWPVCGGWPVAGSQSLLCISLGAGSSGAALGTWWARGGEGQGKKNGGIFREKPRMDVCLPLPTFPWLSPWVIGQLCQECWGGSCPIPQGASVILGECGVADRVSVAREALRSTYQQPPSSEAATVQRSQDHQALERSVWACRWHLPQSAPLVGASQTGHPAGTQPAASGCGHGHPLSGICPPAGALWTASISAHHCPRLAITHPVPCLWPTPASCMWLLGVGGSDRNQPLWSCFSGPYSSPCLQKAHP